MKLPRVLGVDTAYRIHIKLGPGLLESVYEIILTHELRKLGLKVFRQQGIPITYKNIKFDEGFRADIIVEDRVIIELWRKPCLPAKAIEEVSKPHKKKLLTYLRPADKRLELLINFGANLIKDGVFRIVNGLEEES